MPGSRYDASSKAKAVRLLREHAGDYPAEYAAITPVSGRLGRARRRCASGGNTSITEVCDGASRKQMPQAPVGARRQWAADRALRPEMRSPGRPVPSRAVQREFWGLIAGGMTTAGAAESVGVSWPVGARWFRHAGGMPPLSLSEPAGRCLSFAEREEVALLRARYVGVRQIARRLGRDPGTVSRELRRNAATRSVKRVYRARTSQRDSRAEGRPAHREVRSA